MASGGEKKDLFGRILAPALVAENVKCAHCMIIRTLWEDLSLDAAKKKVI